MSLSSHNKLIILDRDGVINEDSDEYVKSLAEWIPIPGSIQAIADLSKAGYVIAVATNQSGIGRGLFDLDELEKMHNKLCALVEEAGGEIAGIFYCPHTPEDGCECRKPRSGLIDSIESELGLPVKNAYIVGDTQRDLEAGFNKGCIPVLVKSGKGQKTLCSLPDKNPALFSKTIVFADLRTFVTHLLASPL
jgi:D-glycero-D-manno-heptose 1,7-bisphosphate phosphatase